MFPVIHKNNHHYVESVDNQDTNVTFVKVKQKAINIFLSTFTYIYIINVLQLDWISDYTGFSLQTAAILLINEIHEITNLVVVGPII